MIFHSIYVLNTTYMVDVPKQNKRILKLLDELDSSGMSVEAKSEVKHS